jgi:hypothetical protein
MLVKLTPGLIKEKTLLRKIGRKAAIQMLVKLTTAMRVHSFYVIYYNCWTRMFLLRIIPNIILVTMICGNTYKKLDRLSFMKKWSNFLERLQKNLN